MDEFGVNFRGNVTFVCGKYKWKKILNHCSKQRKIVTIMEDTLSRYGKRKNLSTPGKKILDVPNKAIPCLTPKNP
jgi:hypothetical protein